MMVVTRGKMIPMRTTILLLNFLVAFSVSAQEISQEQLLANLRVRIPELQGVEMTVSELEPSPYGNLKQGVLTINGQQTIQFLLSEEQSELILLAQAPMDVSLSESQIAGELEQLQEQEDLVAAESHRALSRFADGKPFRGAADAPITIYEFSDFQCPYCARAKSVVDELLNKYPDDIRFVYLHFPLDIHDWAMPAAIAADCAARQDDDAFWTLHDNFFDLQKDMEVTNLIEKMRSWLETAPIDIDQWEQCAIDPSSASNQGVALEIDISIATAKRFGITGTPAFFVNGHLLTGAQPVEAFDALIQRIKANS